LGIGKIYVPYRPTKRVRALDLDDDEESDD